LLAWYDRKYKAADVLVDESLSKRWLVVAGAALVAWIGLSLVMLTVTPKDTATVRVAALRPGYSLPAIADKEHTDQDRFDLFASQAREAAAQGAQVLVTSEIMFGFDPQERYTEEFKALARETNTYIFIGYAVVDQVNLTYRNEMVLLSPSGEFSAVYDKSHPMPGEPVSPTRGYPVFGTPLGKMAAMICHDVDYMDVSRQEAAKGAQLIALGLWTYRGAAEQQWTYATFNAVQSHTTIVAADSAYFSAVIDPNGRQVALDVSREGSPLVMVADVPMGSGNTIYSSIGDVLGWVALAGFAFFFTFMVVVRIRARKAVKK
jgi:apolipoprotein N-acyltransferase